MFYIYIATQWNYGKSHGDKCMQLYILWYMCNAPCDYVICLWFVHTTPLVRPCVRECQVVLRKLVVTHISDHLLREPRGKEWAS